MGHQYVLKKYFAVPLNFGIVHWTRIPRHEDSDIHGMDSLLIVMTARISIKTTRFSIANKFRILQTSDVFWWKLPLLEEHIL